jgi:hypothetical protein
VINLTIRGEARIPKITLPNRTIPRAFKIILAISQILVFSFSKYSVNTGIKAAEKAPSPKKLRRRLGIRNAIKKAAAE